jgi:hypothetical protein
MKLFLMIILIATILHVNFCQAKNETEVVLNGNESPASVTRRPSKEHEGSHHTSEEALTQPSDDAFVLIDKERLIRLIKTNNAGELISAYEQCADRNSLEIANAFYPEKYLQTHCRFSFDELNETAKLCILIAARYNHFIARRIIAGSLIFSEENRAIELRLRGESGEQTDEEIIHHHLETPFFNFIRIRTYLYSESGRRYINGLFEDRAHQENSFVLYNLGKLFTLTGEIERAFDCYYHAGQKGMPDGYIEAAQLILKNPRMGVPFSEIELVETMGVKVKKLAEMAGDEGLWYLADCYRYGRLPRAHAHMYMHYYVDIHQKEEESFYSRQFATMHRSIGDSTSDSSIKIRSYENVVNGLLASLSMGDIFVVPALEESINKLQKLNLKASKESSGFTEVMEYVRSQKQHCEDVRAKFQEINGELTAALLKTYE